MKKACFKIILFLFIIIFVPISVEAKINCSDISTEVEHYDEIVENMKDLDCDNIEDPTTVAKCNKYSLEKSYSLSKIFSFYYDKKTKCSKKLLKPIVEENKDECTSVFGTTLKDIANYGFKLFYITAPFLLIIFGMLDFSKIVVMNDPKTIKESRQKFIKRLISFLLLFLLPAFLNLVFKLNPTGLNYNSNVYSCKSNVLFQMNRWETIYVPSSDDEDGRISSGSASSIMEAAEKVHKKYEEGQWCYYTDNRPDCNNGGTLYWNNIEMSLNNPGKKTCCATFIGEVLYVEGIFTEDEINSYNYNSVWYEDQFLIEKGWKKITNYDDLQAGDIVIMGNDIGHTQYEHTQLYAGDGTWYNAGSTNSIRKDSPYTGSNYERAHFSWAYRKP